MGSLVSTSAGLLGINACRINSSASMLYGSTASSGGTWTCGDIKRVVIFGYNPTGTADISLTLTATTARYESAGRGDYAFTTNLDSSDWFIIAQLEGSWFKSTSNTFTLTATTAIAMFAYELTSTRQL